MKHPGALKMEDYTYDLPKERIAKHPATIRDESKLLLYRDGVIAEDVYKNIANHIPSNTLMVFNQTKVVYARLLFQKPTGGWIEIFCLEPSGKYADMQTAMQQTGKVYWQCLVGGVAKWKPGIILSQQVNGTSLIIEAQLIEKTAAAYIIEISWNEEAMSFAELLQMAGKVPLPPYIDREPDSTDKKNYQTVYAKEEGSVAAPTAGLHFTEAIFKTLESKNIPQEYLTLHVGAGTFKPVKSETMQEHEMHAEWIEISLDSIRRIAANLENGIVAVGTTSLRSLESLYWIGVKIKKGIFPGTDSVAVNQWEPYEMENALDVKESLQVLMDWMENCSRKKLLTRTQILIAPGYSFKIVKGLITNFHQPKSTLLLLVAAFIGEDWKKLYQYAWGHDFRFLSYGDGSLLWRNDNL